MKSPRTLDKMKPLSALAAARDTANSFKHQTEAPADAALEQGEAKGKATGKAADKAAIDLDPVEIKETRAESATAANKVTTARPKSSVSGHIWRLVTFAMAWGALLYVIWNLVNVWSPKVPLFAEGNTLYSLLLTGLLVHGALALGWMALRVFGSWPQSLAASSQSLSDLNTYLVAGVFWSLVLVGLVDFGLTLLRLLDISEAWLGEELSKSLFKKDFRFPFVHLPLILIGFAVARYARGLGFIWLALLIVIAQLISMITHSVFSFSNVFLVDLVRLWYAGLFLLAASYTLLEDGHVRVDVLFSGLGVRAKQRVNLWGSLLLGLPFSWVIILVGTFSPMAGVINGPLSSIEPGPDAGAGLHIQYLMPWLLLILGLILVIQFCALILSSAGNLTETEEAAG